MTDLIKDFVNWFCSPSIFVTAGIIVFFLTYSIRKIMVNSWFNLGLMVAMLLFALVSCLDENFRKIMTKPDNIPIAGLMFLSVFFMWFGMKQAFENDLRKEKGEEVYEGRPEEKSKVFTWPDLVYIELIVMVALTALLIVWSVIVKAPLEQPAHPSKSPNPAKVPWYFLGLQEMLVYFDPWLAGVVFPSLIILGLMAIPFIDRNPKGSGYYTFKERAFAIVSFNFGWIVLWVTLILIGTFLRGPNWNFFGPYEYWDVHKMPPLANVNLSEMVYAGLLGHKPPDSILMREFFGFLAIAVYYLILPPILAATVLKGVYQRAGFLRYSFTVFLFLTMLALPIKMYLRWLFNLKYIVAIPEYFFNI